MFVIESYGLAVLLSFVVMLAWGSWPNTLKLTNKDWKFQLFYWDYAVGVLIFALIMALTLGSSGAAGRGFIADLKQASPGSLGLALLGGLIFNCYNILLVSALDIAGIAVAFPIGVGIALVLGTSVNFLIKPEGNPFLVFAGVAAIALAVVFDAKAYKKIPSEGQKSPGKGIGIALAAGLFGAFFFALVASSMGVLSPEGVLETGKLGPYTAVVMFALGLVLSNFLLNSLVMKHPFSGDPVPFRDYVTKGSVKMHAVGILGGLIWCVGMSFSILASGKAGFAISYGLAQACTMVAAIWGVFIWKEFKKAPAGTGKLLASMFLAYFLGIGFLILSRYY
jgi:glucose uptake protein